MKLSLTRFNNLGQRVLTALIGAAIIIFGCYWSEWAYFIIFFFICGFTILEFYKLAGLDGMLPLKFLGTTNALLLFTLSFLIERRIIGEKFLYLIFPMLAMIFLIKLYKKAEVKPFTNIAYTFLGILYVGLPFSLLNYAVFASDVYNREIVIGLMLLLWASDTGGYFAGIMFGRTKLFERVSPKKSWEGMVGGFILAMAIASLISIYFVSISKIDWYLAAMVMVIAGTYGDLVESLFKRSIEIKDSGNTLPGHGGFLDRFDGLLISIPFFVFVLKVFIY